SLKISRKWLWKKDYEQALTTTGENTHSSRNKLSSSVGLMCLADCLRMYARSIAETLIFRQVTCNPLYKNRVLMIWGY
ncbi:MAG: hypothetical protein AAB972_01720, partial [Patescibacteria group bacterium]